MAGTTFLDLYKSDPSTYALCGVPLLFLVYLLFAPAGRAPASKRDASTRFVYRYSLLFAAETILDPIATGPLTRWLGVGDSAAGTAILLTFVLLGDFRVYLLIFRLAQIERPLGEAIGKAAAWTLVVPFFAYSADYALHSAIGGLPSQTIWLIYELAFLSIALWLRRRGIAARAASANTNLRKRLEAVAGYVAIYYALWATADVLILVFGLDAGWALRLVPNHLYYSFYLPFVFFQLASHR
jgi:hypothetical protein